MDRRQFIGTAAASAALPAASAVLAAPSGGPRGASRTVALNFDGATTRLPHFWEESAGSDRTVVGLRDQWRQDLIRVHRETGIKSIRCHGLFNDEMGIASRGAGDFNFLYVDQIYDFMLDNGVRPFVELSFMPEALASGSNRIFFYRGNASPPRDWNQWRDMVQAFTDHVVKRYGIAEVGGWKFEVWNEPNLPFWSGTQEQYFELYRQSALAVKAVDRRLQVGGPATAQLAWVPDLIRYCSTKGVPLDFISTHAYPSDPQEGMFGKAHKYPPEELIPRGLAMVKQQIAASTMPDLPVWLTEWGSQNPAFLVDTIRNSIGLVEAMSYWTFSNVFEELGPPTLFNKTFGMLDQYGIARPSLHTFAMLHKLGEDRVAASAGPVLATRRADGTAAIAVWNLIPAGAAGQLANGNPLAAANAGEVSGEGPDLAINLQLKGWRGPRTARISHVNAATGTAYPAWQAMGKPAHPSRAQIETLRQAAELPPAAPIGLPAGNEPELAITVPANGVALIELG